MDNSEFQTPRAWDEYEWERFLQKQDRKTEKYMELLEKYLDDPNRDSIIAREMGWHHLADALESGDGDELGAAELADAEAAGFELISDEDDYDLENMPFDPASTEGEFSVYGEEEEEYEADDDEEEEEDDEPEDSAEEGEEWEHHPLYRAAFGFTLWIDRLIERESSLREQPDAVSMSTAAAIASAKIAAALSDEDEEEIGMTIAYLKRSLKAISNSLDSSTRLRESGALAEGLHRQIRERAFQVRDEIIRLMGDYRAEWRRRQNEA